MRFPTFLSASMALLAGLSVACVTADGSDDATSPLSFAVRYDGELRSGPVDGRVVLLIAPADDESEPRYQLRSEPARSAQGFGVDVEGWQPGEAAVIDGSTFGHPIEALADLPAGEYSVQAVLNVYETFELATGHTVSLPPDRGEGQQWNRKPGNLYSTPKTVRVDPSRAGTIEIVLDQVIPEIEPPEDTKYIRHIRMRSDLLSEFWGRDMYVGAHVLVPEGFDEHPEARYPLMVFHGHFPSDFGGFRTEPPDPDLECEYSERFSLECYNGIVQQEAYDLYRKWISPDFPRFLAIEIQHPTPYYDDSYAVNSASQGPWGDALTYELIPYIEERVPRHRGRVGPFHVRWLDRRLGGPRRAGVLSRRVQRRVRCLPGPDRLPGLRAGEHLRGRERLLRPRAVRADGETGPPGLARKHQLLRAERKPRRAGARHEGPVRRAMGHLGGHLLTDGG